MTTNNLRTANFKSQFTVTHMNHICPLWAPHTGFRAQQKWCHITVKPAAHQTLQGKEHKNVDNFHLDLYILLIFLAGWFESKK